MTLDFEKIDSQIVGSKLTRSDDASKGSSASYNLRALTFREFIVPYQDGKTARWEVYHKLRDELIALERANDLTLADRTMQFFVEPIAQSALEREAIAKSMDLMDQAYLKVGNINNDPYRN